MIPLKVITAGGSLALALSEEAVGHLGVELGDTVCAVEAPEGGLRLSRHDPETDRQMAVAQRVGERRRTALRPLAE